jgi:hypothetical protein
MSEIAENTNGLDDGELIARGVIAAEPTRRETVAKGFAWMAWGILFQVHTYAAIFGLVLIWNAAGRLRDLHPQMTLVRRLALYLGVFYGIMLAVFIGFRAWTGGGIPLRGSIGTVIGWTYLSLSWLLTVYLFRKLCEIAEDLAGRAQEGRTGQDAVTRKRILSLFAGLFLAAVALSVVRAALDPAEGADKTTGLSALSGICVALILSYQIMWIVILAQMWGLMRRVQGIVEHSEAFAWLDGEGDDTPAGSAG